MSKILEDCVQIVDAKGSHTDYIKRQVKYQTELGIDDPLAVVDIDEVVERYRKWNKLLPRVELFYALKCNNDRKIVDILVRLRSSFDCSSQGEIQQVLDLGVDPSRIVYANPCKQNSHLVYAKNHNVEMMTFDSEEELVKIKRFYASARLILRFRPKYSNEVRYDLGKKFGCDFEEAWDLFQSAKNKDLNVIGVSFYVGYNCCSPDAFSSSIKEARKIFDIGLQVGFTLNILDIGGGFQGRYIDFPSIEENADIINKSLDDCFPEEEGVKIIAEPGRYLVESAVSTAARIIGRKFVYNDDKTSIGHVKYYINDGKFGSFSAIDDVTNIFVMSPVDEKARVGRYNSSIWGPTCAVTDCLATDASLPLMDVGEWVYVSYTGAYMFSRSTNFNTMPKPRFYYFCSRNVWRLMTDMVSCD